MTGLLHENAFSRKSFLKGGGAVVVGFSLLGTSLAGKAFAAGADPFDSYGPYDPEQIDSWLVVHADNTASVKLGKVELGQGSSTGLLMIAAEELDLEMSQMKMISNDTDVTPDQGITAGSSSIRGGGMQTRAAAAAARQALLGMAASHLGVAASSLTVAGGVVSGGGKSITYGALIGNKLFGVRMGPSYDMAQIGGGLNGTSGVGLAPGAPGTKPVTAYTLVGTSPGPARIDIPAKVTGTYTYVHNVHVPGMLHGRIVRPRGQGAYPSGAPLVSVDAASVAHIPGVRILRKGDFLGVVAAHEYDAIQAAAQLKATWAAPPALPGVGNLFGQMRKEDSAGQVKAADTVNLGSVDTAIKGAAHTISASYSYHYNGHMPIGPTCVVADVTPAGAVLYSNTQDAYSTRTDVARILGMPENKVRIVYYEGSSVYGSSPYEDGALAAALMSQLAGAPVRLQYMRWDEQGWDNYGPAQLMDIRGAVDAKGNIVATDYTGFQIPYYSTDVTNQLVGAVAPVVSTSASADSSNTGTQYNIANRRVTTKTLPLANNYFKTIYLRAPLAPQSLFGYEQMIDELAHAANMDPYQFRLQNITSNAVESSRKAALTWDRWKNVLTEVGKLSSWAPKVAASNLSSGNVVTGRGLALGGFAGTMTGIVADVEVNKKTGKLTITHAYGAQDTGLSVYLGGVENQAVGSMTQGASRALFEEVRFDKSRVTSFDWVTYPIMRFKDAPKISFSVIQRTDIPSIDSGTVAANGVLATGSGEPPTAPMAAAIANGFFDATGVRIREAPMTAGRVRAVLRAAGVA